MAQWAAFLLAFVLTGPTIAAAVFYKHSVFGFVAGIIGLLVHVFLSVMARRGDEDDVGDSSYFLGFMLTLSFLAAGLLKLGNVPVEEVQNYIVPFLGDLAAGLFLTIFALLLRQLRILATSRKTESDLVSTQLQLSKALEDMAKVWRARPEHQVLEDFSQTRTTAAKAAESLLNDVVQAGKKMVEAGETLTTSTTKATESMTRSISEIGGSLVSTSERVDAEMQRLLGSIRSQHEAMIKAAADAHSVAARTREDADKQLLEHLEQWRKSLATSKKALEDVQQGLDTEYKRGLESFEASAEAFSALATQTIAQVRELPNPADHLSGLWSGIAALETKLSGAVGGATKELQELQQRFTELVSALQQLEETASGASNTLRTGGDAFAKELQRELKQMNEIMSDYVKLAEKAARGF